VHGGSLQKFQCCLTDEVDCTTIKGTLEDEYVQELGER
jgi:hypothetical protein